MKSALFKLASREDDPEGIQQQLQDAQVVFAVDEDGNQIEGCFWSIHKRIDEDFICVGIKTTDEIMDMVLQDPRLELVSKGEGWPEPEPEEEIIEI